MRIPELPGPSARACVHILPVRYRACVPLRQSSLFVFSDHPITNWHLEFVLFDALESHVLESLQILLTCGVFG